EKKSDTAGGAKDWLYERLGVPVFLLEMGMFYNYLGFSTHDYHKLGEQHLEETSLALLAAHDADPGIGLFTNWTPFEHPQLGRVEIGGWDTVPWSNPPLEDEMENACEKGSRFLLEYAGWRPALEITSLTAELVGESIYRVRLQLVNKGNLATCLTEQGRKAFEGAEPVVELSGEITCVTGRRKQRVEHLAANGGSDLLEWVVQAAPGTIVTATVCSLRGGYDRNHIELK
ncbi:MAG: hypothetical protein K9N51_12710, partial [Candidatus Pacebacteria bacterium]|nr:hypothetical protein [Candidatus Paceibacterota bacterium]